MSTPMTIAGNLTRDPELRHTSSGTPVVNFDLAHAERRKTSAGEWEDDGTTWLRVTVYGKYAENVAESLHKGDRVVVVGRYRQRHFTRDDGSKGTANEILADEVAPSLRWATAVPVRNGTGTRQA